MVPDSLPNSLTNNLVPRSDHEKYCSESALREAGLPKCSWKIREDRGIILVDSYYKPN